MPLNVPMVTELISFGVGTYPSGDQIWPQHLHSYHQFDATVSGEVWVDFESRQAIRSTRGDGLLIPPLVRHGHRTRKGFVVGMFKLRVAPRYWPHLGDRPRKVRLPRALLESVEAAGEQTKARAPLALQQAIAVGTLCLAQATGPGRRPQPADGRLDLLRDGLWPLLEQVESDPYGPWTVGELAAACHLTPDHFAKRFRELLGHAPKRFLLQARMRAAAHELATDPALPIKELAEKAGYATVHAFSRTFKRVLGVSPGAFRRAPTDL